MIRLIAMREFRSLFSIPSTWLFLAGLEFILAWFFLSRLEAFLEIQPQLALLANPPGVTGTVGTSLFNTASLLLMMLVPMFTMRLIAEERRSHTLALFLSSPVSDAQIVLGKFAGLMLFLLLLIATLPLMLCTLSVGTHLDYGLLLSNCIGIALLTSSFVALGLYVSSLTTQPVIAAIGTLAALIGLWLADIGSPSAQAPWHQFSPLYHFQNFNAGLLDSRDAAFFLIFTVFFLMLAARRLHNNRIYG